MSRTIRKTSNIRNCGKFVKEESRHKRKTMKQRYFEITNRVYKYLSSDRWWHD